MKKNRKQSQKKKSHYHNHIVELQQIIRRGKKRKNQEVKEEERIEINSKLKDIGKDTEVVLPKLHRQWSAAWIEDIKGWQRIFKERRKEEWEQAQRKQIEENINKRCEMIKSDQGRMITSLLNRPYKKIILDRFITQVKEEVNLITEPKAVLSGLAKHYENQFRKRDTKLDEMSKEWKEIYEPKEWIKETWYKSLEKTIEEEE